MSDLLTRTKFRTRVLSPTARPTVIGQGADNQKLGGFVTKGRFKGYKIVTVSLEERATCPTSCHHWEDCYGNNMRWARRVDHTHPEFLVLLRRDLERELAVRGRLGVLVRLHVLGDFYSVDYVRFWEGMLTKHPRLAVFGYTARPFTGTIGLHISWMNSHYPERCVIRQSVPAGAKVDGPVAVGMRQGDAVPAGAFWCPEQTGKTASCGTCAACWSTPKAVMFHEH